MKRPLSKKVSIITVCKNSDKFIDDCLNSVYSQKYKNIEHIIIDGNSTDSTLKKIKSHLNFKNIKLISEDDTGIYNAINKGLKLSTGEIIGILNSDDIYSDDDIILDIVNLFCRNKVNLVYGDILHVKRDNISKITRKWRAGKFRKFKLYFGWLPPHPSCFYKKNIINSNFYNENLKIASDILYLFDIFNSNYIKPYYYEQFIVIQRGGGISTLSMKNILLSNYEFILHVPGNVFLKIFIIFCKLFRKILQIRF